MSYWIVSYDIPSNKRRRKVCKVLEGFGRRVQFSVFECDLDAAKAEKLERRLLNEIDEQEDDIRLYPLNQADLQRVKMMGVAQLRQKADYYIV